ncbi:hypothetical protein P0M11_11220 [Kaistella sp. PBT33-4]|uniref:hypothetical protein n=1 Tax=Kaistella sp. PBT33-4 TaxID=3032000 RepID=UPI0023D83CAF|nr:hypothetical protein [Kaistella sp. PBT33-4]MDF0720568.1 hypothetical protein [Kaistella sp. PBT33-4]
MPGTTSPSLPTTADSHGRNLRPELRAESWFFLENTNYYQTAGNQFGVLDSTVFRTTSRIQFTGKVYSICSGQIFIQPHGSDATKVNLILKPFRQPINGLPIKYIVYRGLQKDNFFDANDIVLDQGNAKATGLTKRIWKEFEDFYANNTALTKPPFKAWLIGFPNPGAAATEQQSPEDYIDDYFFKLSNPDSLPNEPQKKAFELPMIPGGTYIGDAQGSLGIDIVLNEGDFTIENDPNPFTLNLSYARATDHTLNTSLGATEFLKKLIRESATQFIDIAAFYGLHAQGKGKIYLQAPATPANTPDAIYNLISNFQTKNTVYLYIQSNRQRSYNFYGNYAESAANPTNIRIGTDGNSLNDSLFEQNWPLRPFDGQPQVALQLTTDNNPASALYVKQGLVSPDSSHEDYFFRDNNLLQEQGTGINISFTKPITFIVLQTSTAQKIACLIQLVYEGKQISVAEDIATGDPNVPTQTVYRNMKDIDDVFGLINIEARIKPPTDSALHYIVDQNLLLINFENKTGGHDIATVTTKRTEDRVLKDNNQTLDRVTYETLLNDIRQNTGSFFQSLSAYKDNSNSGVITFSKDRNNYYEPESPYYLQTEIFTGSDGTTITGLSLHSSDGAIPSKKLLGITQGENNQVKSLVTQHNLNNPKVYFKNELEDEESYYTSSEGTQYRKYSLCILGENQTGNLEFYEPTPKIYVTTIDNRVYGSEEYSQWVPIRAITRSDIVTERIKEI